MRNGSATILNQKSKIKNLKWGRGGGETRREQRFKSIKKQLTAVIPADKGIIIDLPHLGVYNICVTRSTMSEMIGKKAVKTSIFNDCPALAHLEAAKKYRHLLNSAGLNTPEIPTKDPELVKLILPLASYFVSDDGQTYIAHFKIHVPTKIDAPNKLYFLYLCKEK